MNRDRLIEYGLTEKETDVYLAALVLGSSTVNTIAKKARVFRTYCYDILKSLQKKGLVSTFIKKGIIYYDAADPERLIEILKEKESRIQEVIPELKSLKCSFLQKPTTQVFEGAAGLKAIHEDIIRTVPEGGTIWVYGNSDEIIEALGPFFELYIKSRTEKKITAKVISSDTPTCRKRIVKTAKKELRNIRFLPYKQRIYTTTYIYADKIALISYDKELYGTIIKSKVIAEDYITLFESQWKNSIEP